MLSLFLSYFCASVQMRYTGDNLSMLAHVRPSPEEDSLVQPIQMHYAVSDVVLQQQAHV